VFTFEPGSATARVDRRYGHAICDRCGYVMDERAIHTEFHNLAMFRFRAGAGSRFGEGRYIEGDLCDACLFTLLGRYVRAYDEDWRIDVARRNETPLGVPLSRRPSMNQTESRPQDVTVVICDRCKKRMYEEEPDSGYRNRMQIRFRGGYGSLFGDGNKVEGDLCDSCFYELLGPYLRIVESIPDEAKQYNDLTYKPLDSFFELQARRVYSPYQTQYQTAEEMAVALRDWIDRQFDPNLKRTPVMSASEAKDADS